MQPSHQGKAKAAPFQPPAPVELLSRREAAAYLGIAPQTLAAWKCLGRYDLPTIKVGRLAKYRRADLEAFIARRTTNTCQ